VTRVTRKLRSQASRTALSTHWSVRQPTRMRLRVPRLPRVLAMLVVVKTELEVFGRTISSGPGWMHPSTCTCVPSRLLEEGGVPRSQRQGYATMAGSWLLKRPDDVLAAVPRMLPWGLAYDWQNFCPHPW